MFTRREFLASSASAGVGLASAAAAPSWARTAAQVTAPVPYIGYVSVRRDNRVSIFTMDPASGKVMWQQQVPVEGGPDPIALDPRGRFLYVACRDRQRLSSYRIDPATGEIKEYALPANARPHTVTLDAKGNVWYTGNANATIGYLEPRTGKITEFKMPDPAAKDPYLNRDQPFPTDAVLLKEEYDFSDTTCSGEILRWTVMSRLEQGSSPDTLDWRWQTVDPERHVVEQDPPRCQGCHSGCTAATDGYEGTCTVP